MSRSKAVSTLERPRINDLGAFWMPFTANRDFKRAPRLFVHAEGMRFITDEGARCSMEPRALWCVNAGHCRRADRRGDTPSGGRTRLRRHLPDGPHEGVRGRLEAGQHRAAGLRACVLHQLRLGGGRHGAEDRARLSSGNGNGIKIRLIGRERGYHGSNFGGTAVGGIVGNRRLFGALLAGVDHMRHTHDLARNAFSRGEPEHGAELADDLERLVALHDASTIAAVIVEPVACSAGVFIPRRDISSGSRQSARATTSCSSSMR